MRPHSPLQRGQDAVEQSLQLRQQRTQPAASVQQISNIAQQVSEKIACTRDRRDVQDHLIQVDRQPKKIQVQGPEYEIQDLAVGINSGNW